MNKRAIFEALCKATGPDEVLDHHLLCLHLGYDRIEVYQGEIAEIYYGYKNGVRTEIQYSEMLQVTKYATDAMILIPEYYRKGPGEWYCGEKRGRPICCIGPGGAMHTVQASTLPLAICLAYVHHLIQKEQADVERSKQQA